MTGYVQEVSDGNFLLSVDLDEGALCNSINDDEDHNMGCDEEAAALVQGGCKMNYFAVKDIKAGEELLCSYGEFAVLDKFEHFGLQ